MVVEEKSVAAVEVVVKAATKHVKGKVDDVRLLTSKILKCIR